MKDKGGRRRAEGRAASQPKRLGRKPAAKDVAHIAADLRPLAVPMDGLVLDPKNARTHDPRNVEGIAASLRKFGQLKPIVVHRTTGVVEAGNGTFLAAEKLGWKYLAAVRVEHDPASAAGFAIADNRTAELAGWDDAVLADLWEEHGEALRDLGDALLLSELLPSATADKPEPEGVPEEFKVVVDCRDEEDQKKFHARMQKEKRPCRVLTF